MDDIAKRDKDDWWKLKAICCKVSLKLYQKYLVENVSSKTVDERKKQQKMFSMTDQQFKNYKDMQKAFIKEFNEEHMKILTQSHLNIVLLKQSQFVGTTTLCISLKFLAQSFSFAVPRQLVSQHIETILHKIALPLFVCTQKDA